MMSDIDIVLAALAGADIFGVIFLGSTVIKYGWKAIKESIARFIFLFPLVVCVAVAFKLWVSFSLPIVAIIFSAICFIIVGWIVNIIVCAFTMVITARIAKIPLF